MPSFTLFRFIHFATEVKPSPRFYPILMVYVTKAIVTLPFELLESVLFDRKVKQHQLKQDPIFILGYWRSGTTYLHRLMATNADFGYLNFYESFIPTAYLTTESMFAPVMQFFCMVFGVQHPAHRIPLRMQFPSEEDIGLALAFDPHSFSRSHIAPSQFDVLFSKYVALPNAQDRRNFQQSYDAFVRKLSFHKKGKPLVLKTPANLGRIDALLELYPNARFIVIQRNPYEVFSSNVNFWKTLRPHALEPISDEFIESNVLKTYVQMTELYQSQVGSIPASHLAQVRYEDLKSDPQGVVEKIYSQFNMAMNVECRTQLQKFIQKNHNEACADHKVLQNLQTRKISQQWKKQIEVAGYESI